MAALWEHSLHTIFHPTTGALASGALAYFYDEDTTTPRTVYQDAALTTPHTHPVVASASGLFPAIFLQTGNYRTKVTTSSGTQIWDVDNISPPITTEAEASGGTEAQYLIATGQLIHKYGTGTVTGFVRANGRTIGNAASSATERANADTSDLFTFLYNADANLSVSGGRGANAAADFAANKTIALPDMRGRALVGLDDMGNSAAGVITGATTLGAALGAQSVTLDATMIPSHTHTGTTDNESAHKHFVAGDVSSGSTLTNANQISVIGNSGTPDLSYNFYGSATAATLGLTSSGSAHNHTFTTGSTGGGGSHTNLQPSTPVTIYIKL